HAGIVVAQGLGPGGVGADAISLHVVAAGAAFADANTLVLVPRDEVPRPGGRAPDGVAAPGDGHANRVAQGQGAGHVRADVVALDQVAVGVAGREQNAVTLVAGDDVARPRRRPPDGVVVALDGDPRLVAQRGGTGDIGADEVTRDQGGVGEPDVDTRLRVARDQVAGARPGAANHVGRVCDDEDACPHVA